MKEYRIVKYDYSDPDYLKEWIGVSGINKKKYNLTKEEYLRVENNHINLVIGVVKKLNLKEVLISDFYENRPYHIESIRRYSFGIENFNRNIINNSKITIDDLPDYIRLCLREFIWCRISAENNFYLHFGYDFYTYLGYDDDFEITQDVANQYNLYADKFRSPYWPEDDDGNVSLPFSV